MKLIHLLKKIYRYFYPKAPNCKMGSDVIIDNRAHIYNSSDDPRRIKIGDNSHIDGELMIWKNAGEIEIGQNTYIGLGTRIWSAKKITIGDRVQIAHNSNIFDSNIHSLDPVERFKEYTTNTTIGLIKEANWNEKEVIVEDDAWIGANVAILKGVRIGKGAVVGIGSVVVHDVPKYAIVAGNPAKIIKEIKIK